MMGFIVFKNPEKLPGSWIKPSLFPSRDSRNMRDGEWDIETKEAGPGFIYIFPVPDIEKRELANIEKRE